MVEFLDHHDPSATDDADCEASGDIGADELFARLSAETTDLSLAIGHLEQVLGPLLIAAGPRAPVGAVATLQDADRVVQTLRALSRVLAWAAPHSCDLVFDRGTLQREIGLDSVAARLLGPDAPDDIPDAAPVGTARTAG